MKMLRRMNGVTKQKKKKIRLRTNSIRKQFTPIEIKMKENLHKGNMKGNDRIKLN